MSFRYKQEHILCLVRAIAVPCSRNCSVRWMVSKNALCIYCGRLARYRYPDKFPLRQCFTWGRNSKLGKLIACRCFSKAQTCSKESPARPLTGSIQVGNQSPKLLPQDRFSRSADRKISTRPHEILPDMHMIRAQRYTHSLELLHRGTLLADDTLFYSCTV